MLLQDWTVPMRTSTGPVEVKGTTSWVPFEETLAARPEGDGGSPAWLAAGGGAALLVVDGAVTRRRRRRRVREPERELEHAA
ncbi:MAG: hypothetical protein WKF32_06070 [Thermoleophilaceae bacterium]